MTNQLKPLIIAGAALLLVILIAVSSFTVNETEQVIITQFGAPVGNPIIEPGMYFRIPLIQQANFLEKRFLEWDGDPNEVPTKDKRFIYVDTYARWQIKDPLLFYQKLQNEKRALSRLDDILDGETRNVVASHDLVEVVRSSNRKFTDSLEYSGSEEQTIERMHKIKFGRSALADTILRSANKQTMELGIQLLDLRFKRLNYTATVQDKIFERMITERRKIAEKFRSEGQGEASKILGDKERELKRIESEAYRTAQEIKGKADAQAANIYAKSYNQSGESREFYKFLKTMESYKKTLTEKDMLILSTKSDFFQFLQKIQ